MTQRIIPIHSPRFIAEDALDNPPDWAVVFGNSHPLALEIGCGTGHFVLERARVQPCMNFLAIDIYNKGCLKTCALKHAGCSTGRCNRRAWLRSLSTARTRGRRKDIGDGASSTATSWKPWRII